MHSERVGTTNVTSELIKPHVQNGNEIDLGLCLYVCTSASTLQMSN